MATRSSLSTTYSSDAENPLTLEDAVQHLLSLDGEPARLDYVERGLLRFPVDELLPFLRAEAERHRHINAHAALSLCEVLLYLARLVDRPDHWALGLMAKGDALYCLGRYHDSLALYEEARQAFLEQRDEVGWARTYLGWVLSAHFLGRGEEAVESVGRAYEVLVRHQE